MTQKKIRKIHLIYGCVTALLILIVAVGLIVGCVNIYQSGDRPFSREAVSVMLRQISIPGWLCLVAVIGAVALHFAFPLEPEKSKALRCDKDMLLRYRAKYAELTDEAQKKADREVKLRRTYKIITAIITAGLAVYPVIYYADASHFSVDNLNGDIVKAVLVALLPTAAALILVYLCGRLELRSIGREIAVYKANSVKPGKATRQEVFSPRRTAMIRCVILVAAVVLIALGIANGGANDVLGKAIRICTECIGLG